MENRLKKSIQELCILIHTESPEHSSDVRLESLLSLNTQQLLGIVSRTVEDLILTRSKILKSGLLQECMNHQMYQKAMRKLENENRSHIKTQQELKIAIDSLENEIEAVDKEFETDQNSYARQVDELRDDNLQKAYKKYSAVSQKARIVRTMLADKNKECEKLRENVNTYSQSIIDKKLSSEKEEENTFQLKRKYEKQIGQLETLRYKLARTQNYLNKNE